MGGGASSARFRLNANHVYGTSLEQSEHNLEGPHRFAVRLSGISLIGARFRFSFFKSKGRFHQRKEDETTARDESSSDFRDFNSIGNNGKLPEAKPSSGSAWKRQILCQTSDRTFVDTPRDHEESASYPYYCPLCMRYFMSLLVSPCCGNYTCYGCAVAYLKSKKVLMAAEELIPVQIPSYVNCCHCTRTGTDECSRIMYIPVDHSEPVRSYKDEVDLQSAMCRSLDLKLERSTVGLATSFSQSVIHDAMREACVRVVA